MNPNLSPHRFPSISASKYSSTESSYSDWLLKMWASFNGDAASLEPFQAKSKKAYNGLCLVIVAADKGASGTIKVNGASKGLKPASVTMNISK